MVEETNPEEIMEPSSEDEALQLGGSIELSGFRKIDRGTMTIVKKIVGTYAKKFSERVTNMQLLSVNMKKVHETEANAVFDLHAKLVSDEGTKTAEVNERNIFVAIDNVLKKIENSLG